MRKRSPNTILSQKQFLYEPGLHAPRRPPEPSTHGAARTGLGCGDLPSGSLGRFAESSDGSGHSSAHRAVRQN